MVEGESGLQCRNAARAGWDHPCPCEPCACPRIRDAVACGAARINWQAR